VDLSIGNFKKKRKTESKEVSSRAAKNALVVRFLTPFANRPCMSGKAEELSRGGITRVFRSAQLQTSARRKIVDTSYTASLTGPDAREMKKKSFL